MEPCKKPRSHTTWICVQLFKKETELQLPVPQHHPLHRNPNGSSSNRGQRGGTITIWTPVIFGAKITGRVGVLRHPDATCAEH